MDELSKGYQPFLDRIGGMTLPSRNRTHDENVKQTSRASYKQLMLMKYVLTEFSQSVNRIATQFIIVLLIFSY